MDEKSEMIDRIQYLIAQNSKTKSQILRELHLSTSTLSDWKKGKGNPSSSAIIKLARYFNVSSDYLLFGTDKTDSAQLTLPEDRWLQTYHMFSEAERQDIYSLSELSTTEKNICSAFIRGVLAEKKIKESSLKKK